VIIQKTIMPNSSSLPSNSAFFIPLIHSSYLEHAEFKIINLPH
jgi:hypothetical protein